MSVVLVTGSCGLIGSEAVAFFSRLGYDVVGIDNDMRSRIFGADASTAWVRQTLERDCPSYKHTTWTSAIRRRSARCSRSTAARWCS